MTTTQGFPRPFTLGGQVQGDKVLMGGTHKGDIELMGGGGLTLTDYIINQKYC